MASACMIILTQEASGLMNVSAPMQYKALCRDILRDAEYVVQHERPEMFFNPGRTLIVEMTMEGRVNVQAPLPPKEWCLQALKHAWTIIDQFDAPEQKMRPAGYADCLPTPG